MATDDVHDLFDREEGEESDDPAEESDEPTGSSASFGSSSTEDGDRRATDDPTREATPGSAGPERGVRDDESGSADAAEDVHDLFGRGPAEGSTADPPGDETAGSTDATGRDDDVFGEVETSGSMPSSGKEAEGDFGGFESPSTDPEGLKEDDPAGSEPMASESRERSIRDDADETSGDSTDAVSSHDAPTDTVSTPDASTDTASSPGGGHDQDPVPESTESPTAAPRRSEESDLSESDTNEPASERSETAAGDDADVFESSRTAIFSEGVDAEGDEDTASGDTSTVAEGATTGEPETGDDHASAGAGAAPFGGTTDDDPAPSTPAEASTDASELAGSGGFVTASPTEDEEPVVDEETVASALSDSGRLSTGIDVLDEAMGGGVPPGRLVLLVADPGVQSELIVDSLLTQRDTLYVTTDRPDWEVQKDIEPGLGSGEIEIRDRSPDSLLSGVDALLDEIGTTSNFVLDSVNELELVSRGRYRIFISDVKRRLFETGSIGLLTGVTVDHESARDLTLRRADIVWRIETRSAGGELEHWFSLPKFRGGAAMTETVKLQLTDEVRVDPGWQDG